MHALSCPDLWRMRRPARRAGGGGPHRVRRFRPPLSGHGPDVQRCNRGRLLTPQQPQEEHRSAICLTTLSGWLVTRRGRNGARKIRVPDETCARKKAGRRRGRDRRRAPGPRPRCGNRAAAPAPWRVRRPGVVRQPADRHVERGQHLSGRRGAVRHAGLEPAELDGQPVLARPPPAATSTTPRRSAASASPTSTASGCSGRATATSRSCRTWVTSTPRPARDTKDAEVREHASRTPTRPRRPGYYKVGLDSGASAELTTTARTGTGRVRLPGGQARQHAVPHLQLRERQHRRDRADRRRDPDGDRLGQRGQLLRPAEREQPARPLHAVLHRPLRPALREGRHLDRRRAERRAPPRRPAARLQLRPATRSRARAPARYVTFAPGTRHGAGQGRDLVRQRRERRGQPARGEPAEQELRLRPAPRPPPRGTPTCARSRWAAAAPTSARTFYTALYHSMLEPTLTSDVDGQYLGADRKTTPAAPGPARAVRHLLRLGPVPRAGAAADPARPAGRQRLRAVPLQLRHASAAASGTAGCWRTARPASCPATRRTPPSPASTPSAAATSTSRARWTRWSRPRPCRPRTTPTARAATSSASAQRPALDKYLSARVRAGRQLPLLGRRGRDAGGRRPPTSASPNWPGRPGTSADQAEVRRPLAATGRTSSTRTPPRRAATSRDRKADGTWVGPNFTPGTGNGFVEGSSARYTWMVYSDVAGLAQAMGGDKAAIDRLDAFFRTPDGSFDFTAQRRRPATTRPTSPTSTRLTCTTTWAPRTRRRRPSARRWTRCGPTPRAASPATTTPATMSSWYVFSALGMYPQVPQPRRTGAHRAAVPARRDPHRAGRTITINGPRASAANEVHPVPEDRRPDQSDKPWVPASFVTHGGTLDYTLGSTPEHHLGQRGEGRPAVLPGRRRRRSSRAPHPARSRSSPAARADTTLKVSDASRTGRQTSTGRRPRPTGITLTPPSGDLTVPAAAPPPRSSSVTVAAGTKAGVYTIPLTLTSSAGARRRPKAWLSVTVGVKGSVSWNVNNSGVSADDTDPAANFDGGGWSYSAKALAAAGVDPGRHRLRRRLRLHLAPGDARRPGQHPGRRRRPGPRRLRDLRRRHPAEPAGQRRRRAQPAARSPSPTPTAPPSRPTSASATGPSAAGRDQPSFGNTVAVHTTYRDVMGGSTTRWARRSSRPRPSPSRRASSSASVTLPATTTGGDMHVFAVATA